MTLTELLDAAVLDSTAHTGAPVRLDGVAWVHACRAIAAAERVLTAAERWVAATEAWERGLDPHTSASGPELEALGDEVQAAERALADAVRERREGR